MGYLLNDSECSPVTLEKNQKDLPKFSAFRDKELLDNDESVLMEEPYQAEGWVESVYIENEASGKQLVCHWISPAGNHDDATNWRELSEVDLFEVSEAEYTRIQDRIDALEEANDAASDQASKLIEDVWLEFIFEPKVNSFICTTDPAKQVELKSDLVW